MRPVPATRPRRGPAATERVSHSRVEPMKAVLSDEPFSDPAWIFERKLDGVRCLAVRENGAVRLVSRTGRNMNGSYPELVEALERERSDDFIADGEIVAFHSAVTSFARLQGRMQLSDPGAARRTGIPVFLYVFDLLRHDGEDLRRLPLRERKARLRRSLNFHGPVRFTPHRNQRGEELFREACKNGLEGIIAKRADSPYRSGGRSRDWLKLKCHAEQELVIGGFTAPKGSRTEFGALLVGYYEDGDLRYAGKVGTGFGRSTLADLGRRMRALEQDAPPFVDVHPIPRTTRWVRPELVAEIAFSEWTRDGRLRHPRYLGLRDDKPAREVVRERP
jgi:bifunctional non-homologous end joining protein LigD